MDAIVFYLAFGICRALLNYGAEEIGLHNMLALVAAIICILSLSSFLAFLLPLLVRPKPWLHTYGLIVLSLRMMECPVLALIGLPLLVYWCGEPTQLYLRGAPRHLPFWRFSR